jgi:GTP-binding protein HflX
VLAADLIVHVRDAAHAESDAQKGDVLKVLAELGVPEDRPMIEVLNKIDLLPPAARNGLLDGNDSGVGAVAVSALTGDGVPALLARLETKLSGDNIHLSLTLDASDGAGLAWIYRHARVSGRRDRAGKIALSLTIHPQDTARLESRFPGKINLYQKFVS